MGKNRSLSAGLPASITRSRIKPLRPVVRLSLWPYSTLRLTLTMMSACGSKADDLFVGGDRLAMKNATFGLPDDPLDQRAIAAELRLPRRCRRVRRLRQLRRGLIGSQGRAGQLDQLTVMRDPVWSNAGVLDRARPLFRRAPMIAPHERARDQGLGRPQQPHHHPHRIPDASQRRLLSLGSCSSAAVLSSRTTLPVSTFA